MNKEKINLNIIFQQQEEEFAIMSLNQSLIAKIEDVKFIGDKHEPDFVLNYNGKFVGLEIVTLHPFENRSFNTPKEVENYISKFIRSHYRDLNYSVFSIIYIALGPRILYSSGKLKNDIEVNQAILDAFNGEVNAEFFVEFRIVDLTEDIKTNDIEYFEKLKEVEQKSGQKFPLISFNNPGGIQIPIDENDIVKALALKESKYPRYISYDGIAFDEVWLCMNLPNDEYGFTIKAAPIPPIKSRFNRIFLSQNTIPFSRLIYTRK